MKPGQFDVVVKAVKPRRVVTIARFNSYERAAECSRGLRALGFMTIVEWKLSREERKASDEKWRKASNDY